MKIKKQHILITALFTVVNFIVLIILQFRLYVGLDKILRIIFEQTFLSNFKEFGIIVSSGIFTGAVLTFLISIVDYRSEKENTLEEIFYVTDELHKLFKGMKTFFPDEPWELVKAVFIEIDWNESAEKTNKNIDEQIEKANGNEMIIRELLQWKTSLNNDAEIRFKEYLWERTENKEDIYGNREQYLDELYNIKIEKYKKDLDEVLLGYLQFNSVSTKSMWNAYKKINFMFSNKTKRHFIHKAICMQLYEKINFMKRMYPTIENYFKGEDIPRFLMMDIIEKVQKEFIKEKEDYYFKKFAYNISCELDQILSWTHKHRNLEELTKESEYSVRKQYGRGRILYDEE